LRRLAYSYRRVRNTARNLLGNLYDYDPARDALPYGELLELDRWALGRLSDFLTRCRRAYDAYEFHIVYHALNNFCSVDLSALYFDIVKDRLYCSARDSRERRSAQTTMHAILDALARCVAPILSFTAEEIWLATPGESRESSVMLCGFPEPAPEWSDAALATRWERIWEIRAEVTKALEAKRKAGDIGHSLDARVVLAVSDADRGLLEEIGLQDLAYLFIVSQVELAEGPAPAGLAVDVTQAKGAKCGRCWNYSTAVATHDDHPLLCDRCYAVVSEAR
jgi:isoleucyl-tRNA synthetase